MFYQYCLRNNLSLEVRTKLGELLAEANRDVHSKEWKSLKSKREKYAEGLRLLKRDGCIPIKIPYSKEVASELYEYASSRKLERNGNEAPPLIEGVEELPGVKKILKNQELFEFISLYLGGIAEVHQVRLWWDFPVDKKTYAAQRWHRDGEDFKVVKLFIYATDVDEMSGAHCYLPGSHCPKESKKLFTKEDLDDPGFYGGKYFVDGAMHDSQFQSIKKSRREKKWVGEAGTCFIEDVCGLHAGTPPIESPRLMMTVSWVLGRGKTKRVQVNDKYLVFNKD